VEACHGVSMKFSMHPFVAHTVGWPLFSTLKNKRSVAPPLTLGFKMSVTGEHAGLLPAGVSAARDAAVPGTPARIGIR
jgi:hypothetical protein